jgi:hypothetical protein
MCPVDNFWAIKTSSKGVKDQQIGFFRASQQSVAH